MIVDFAEILNYEIYDNSEKRIFGYAPAGNYGDFGFGILGASTEGRCNDMTFHRFVTILYSTSEICGRRTRKKQHYGTKCIIGNVFTET